MPSDKDKRIYFFAPGKTEGCAAQKDLLGGKGANLCDMTRAGLPVPPGFVITTQACADYHKRGQRLPPGLMDEVQDALARLEKATRKRFGDPARPLLLSVRSGAAVSMPGMMDTILNLGMNDAVTAGLAKLTGNRRFAWDCYQRLISMFGEVVMGIGRDAFDVGADELDEDQLPRVVEHYKQVYHDRTGRDWPQEPFAQLEAAIGAVFRSWNAPRAVRYRQINSIHKLAGTAVTVQAMVFGNAGDDCATGVAFTRNPSTGKNELYGEFLVNAQGEDIVAGLRTPLPLAEMKHALPRMYRQLRSLKGVLETRYRDMQDIEFTVEHGKLYLLQTRTGKRTAAAAVKIAVDLVREGLIDRKTALGRVDAAQIAQLCRPRFDPAAVTMPIATGLPASPGPAVGRIAFMADEAERRAKAGEKIILVRVETDTNDIGGMHAAAGILTASGGMTSHAAVEARAMDKPCVVGAGMLAINAKTRRLTVGGRAFGPDDWLSIDGSTGEVFAGRVPVVQTRPTGAMRTFLGWSRPCPPEGTTRRSSRGKRNS